MRFQIDIINKQRKITVSSIRLSMAARKILKIFHSDGKFNKFKKTKLITLSIVLIGSKKMSDLNLKYRGKHNITDVLSFPLAVENPSSEEIYLGEIIICPEKAKSQSLIYGVSLWDELLRLTVHGILHLLGYDHERSTEEERKMRRLEQKILCKLKS